MSTPSGDLAILCEHLAVNPTRRAVITCHPPVHPTDSGLVALCADGDNPCSEQGSSLSSDGLITVCRSHLDDLTNATRT